MPIEKKQTKKKAVKLTADEIRIINAIRNEMGRISLSTDIRRLMNALISMVLQHDELNEWRWHLNGSYQRLMCFAEALEPVAERNLDEIDDDLPDTSILDALLDD